MLRRVAEETVHFVKVGDFESAVCAAVISQAPLRRLRMAALERDAEVQPFGPIFRRPTISTTARNASDAYVCTYTLCLFCVRVCVCVVSVYFDALCSRLCTARMYIVVLCTMALLYSRHIVCCSFALCSKS